MNDEGSRSSQFKFNNLFNEHFPKLIYFSKVFCRVKTVEVEVDCHPKMVRLMVTLTNLVISRGGLNCAGLLALL